MMMMIHSKPKKKKNNVKDINIDIYCKKWCKIILSMKHLEIVKRSKYLWEEL